MEVAGMLDGFGQYRFQQQKNLLSSTRASIILLTNSSEESYDVL